MSNHTYNNKNTPGGRRRVVTSKSREQDEQKIKDGITPPNRNDYNEERRQSIAQLRVAERLAEEQQSVETGITDDSLSTQFVPMDAAEQAVVNNNTQKNDLSIEEE